MAFVMEGPIFQELCSPADANCCSVFACGFNWIVHLCYCADYFALINTCRAAATTASLQHSETSCELEFCCGNSKLEGSHGCFQQFSFPTHPQILGFNPKKNGSAGCTTQDLQGLSGSQKRA